MLNFVNFVAKALLWFFSFSGNIAKFFTSMARFAVFRTAIKYMIFTAFLASLLLLISVSMAFFYYLVDSLIRIYNLISAIINMYSAYSGSADATMSTFFYFMKIMGITDAINAIFPFIASAILFNLIKVLYKSTLSLINQFRKVVLFVIGVL